MSDAIDELSQTLQVASAAIERAELAPDLRAAGFAYALEVLGAGAGPGLVRESPGSAERASGARSADISTKNNRLPDIAARLGLPSEAVELIYEDDGQEIRLIVPRALLPDPTRRAASMRQVSLLAAVGRQAAQLEEYTAYSLMREECVDLKVLDAPNFATEIAKLSFRVRGGRNSREAKANRHHYADAAELITSIIRAQEK